MRDPVLAGVLSLIIPGVGQLYNGRILAGILWLIFTPGFWLGTGGTLLLFGLTFRLLLSWFLSPKADTQFVLRQRFNIHKKSKAAGLLDTQKKTNVNRRSISQWRGKGNCFHRVAGVECSTERLRWRLFQSRSLNSYCAWRRRW